MGGVAVFGGVIVAAIGLILLLTMIQVSLRRRNDAVAATLAEPLRGSFREIGTGPFRLRGMARAADGAAPVPEPLSGAASLWYRLEGYRPRPRTPSNDPYAVVFAESESTEIVIEDERGAVARVDPAAAGYLVPLDTFGGLQVAVPGESVPWTAHEFTDTHHRRLVERFGEQAEPARSVRRYHLAPDSPVTVTGRLERAGEGWLVTGDGPGSVVIATVDDEAIRDDRADRRRNRRVLGMISLAMVVVGVAATWWGVTQTF